MADQSRQTDVSEEIEITDSMVEAGKRVFWNYKQGFDTEEILLSCIFQAMAEASPALKVRRIVIVTKLSFPSLPTIPRRYAIFILGSTLWQSGWRGEGQRAEKAMCRPDHPYPRCCAARPPGQAPGGQALSREAGEVFPSVHPRHPVPARTPAPARFSPPQPPACPASWFRNRWRHAVHATGSPGRPVGG